MSILCDKYTRDTGWCMSDVSMSHGVSLLFIFKLNLKLLQSNGVDVTSKFNERNATGRF